MLHLVPVLLVNVCFTYFRFYCLQF